MGGMKSTIDSAGRLVIPKQVRLQAGLEPGMALEIRWKNGRVEIEPSPLAVRLVQRGHLVVAVPDAEGLALSAETVEETRRDLASGRA
jgi:AbrB family looped-hinge helix DNA binding protein